MRQKGDEQRKALQINLWDEESLKLDKVLWEHVNIMTAAKLTCGPSTIKRHNKFVSRTGRLKFTQTEKLHPHLVRHPFEERCASTAKGASKKSISKQGIWNTDARNTGTRNTGV